MQAKRGRIIPYLFNKEQEEDIAEWYRGHDILYDRRKREYKETDKKNAIYVEKAASLSPQCSVKQLKNWLESMRTQYGKLTHPKSVKGGEGEKLTDREKWIVDTFSFLESHIVRQPSRASFSVSTYIHLF